MPRLFESLSLSAFGLALIVLSACDSTTDIRTGTFSVIPEGSGSGTIRTQSIALDLEIECRITEGQVTGTCEDDFVVPESDGFIRIRATPSPATVLNWGAPCRLAQGAVCDVEYEGGAPAAYEVRASFDAKTRRVVMDPADVFISVPGDGGAVVISAQAVDRDGADVGGITYSFEVDRTDIVSMTPQSANSVRVTGIANGKALVKATAQGVTGTAPVEVDLSN